MYIVQHYIHCTIETIQICTPNSVPPKINKEKLGKEIKIQKH